MEMRVWELNRVNKMTSRSQYTITRRLLLAGLSAPFVLLRDASAVMNQPASDVPIDLGHGLEIRDFRLFPTTDVMRFIVEIHNTTDTPIDTPSVGVVLPHLPADSSFGVANPVAAVLHPGTSGCLIGVAPMGLTSDLNWSEPTWTLCGETQTINAMRLTGWDFSFSAIVHAIYPTHAIVDLEIENISAKRSTGLCAKGIVRDQNNRICGGVGPYLLDGVEPSERFSTELYIYPEIEYILSPFPLLETVEGITVSFTLQPFKDIVPPTCEPVLPWNQSVSRKKP